MITLAILIFMTIIILSIAVLILTIGGTIFTIFASDIIVAVFVIWIIFSLLKKKKGKRR